MTNPLRAILLAALAALSAVGCNRDSGKPAAPPPPPPAPVTVAKAEQVDAPVIIRAIGSVESAASVMLRPQVAGRIAELPAGEGTDVPSGQTLVHLDPRPFDAALKQAEADLAKSTAMADDSRQNAQRLHSAMQSAASSPREVEIADALAAAADAQVLSDSARVDSARLNLAYCTIAAPFAGRLGQFLVKPGSIVKENDTDLVELVQIDPIEVSFTIREEELGQVQAASAAGPLRIEATPSGETGSPVAGTLTFIDNKVDPQSGTVRLKATVPNADRRLWPGRFANVSLVVKVEAGAISIPASAVQNSQSGPAVYILKPDQTVELRPVSVRRTQDGRSIIDRGIDAGETVVTDGQLRLAPGAKVQVKS